MVFKSDRQRKAVMAQLNQPKASVSPQVTTDKNGLGKAIRERISKFKLARERKATQKARKRIASELKSQASEAKKARRLEAELKLEQSREKIRSRIEKAQAEFKKIDAARREKTIGGKVLRAERAIAKKGIELGKRGIKRFKEVERAKFKRRRKRKRTPRETIAPFGIRL